MSVGSAHAKELAGILVGKPTSSSLSSGIPKVSLTKAPICGLASTSKDEDETDLAAPINWGSFLCCPYKGSYYFGSLLGTLIFGHSHLQAQSTYDLRNSWSYQPDIGLLSTS